MESFPRHHKWSRGTQKFLPHLPRNGNEMMGKYILTQDFLRKLPQNVWNDLSLLPDFGKISKRTLLGFPEEIEKAEKIYKIIDFDGNEVFYWEDEGQKNELC